MNPIKNNPSPVERTAGGYATNAMRAIRALQEQMKELGKRLQDEMTNPSLSGTAQQELMRDLAQQMNSIQIEIEALQDSIIQHASMAALKKTQASERQAAPPAQQFGTPVPTDPSTASTPGQPEKDQENNSRPAIRINAIGTVIDTKA